MLKPESVFLVLTKRKAQSGDEIKEMEVTKMRKLAFGMIKA